jgi:alkaline phosphatase D
MAAQMAADPLSHFMLWMGDNLYLRPQGRNKFVADFASAADMEARYRDVRSKPFLQKLFAATHHYAIWDDHDYGPNNSFKNFPLKEDSLRLFKRYWPNPDMGSKELPGTWCRFSHQDAEFFLLDDRYYRDDEEAPPSETKAMFGPAQMAWLKSGLKASRANFKLIAGGDQFLSENKNGVYSGWHSYQTERDDFLDWLRREKIPGIIFLSGDRHNTQVFKLDIDGGAPIYEFCSSPLTSRLSKLSKTEWANPRLVKELALEKRNFGTLEFSGEPGARKVIARCFDSRGELQWTRELAAAARPA